MRIYIENIRGREASYQVTPELCARVPGLAGSDVTLGWQDEPDLAALARAEVFVGSGFDVRRIAEHAPAVRLVHSTSAGVERYLPLDWLPDGAVLTNSSGIHSDKAQEYVTWALLALQSDLPAFIAQQRERRWAPRLTPTMAGRHAVVLGFGAIGQAAARAAKAIGMRVTGVSRSGEPHPLADAVVPVSQLEEVLGEADALVLCCPLTPDTRGMIGPRALGRLRRGALLVNIARGGVVDAAAVRAALRDGTLGGAVIDVFEEEPLPADSQWWDTPNVLITPHVSCDLPDGYAARSLEIVGRNVQKLRQGADVSQLENVVSGAQGY